jgi:hypothetical protein
MARNTRERRLLAAPGRPNFNVTVYALRKDGLVGCASMHEGYEYIAQFGQDCRRERAAHLFSKA